MAGPGQVDVWIGLDVGKSEHSADVLDNDGERLSARAVRNDQGDLEALLERAPRHGTPGLVIDQPGRSPSSPSRWLPAAACRWPACPGW